LLDVNADDVLAPYRGLPVVPRIIPADVALAILCAALTDDDELADPKAVLTSAVLGSPRR
jgi:hypothetical protein